MATSQYRLNWEKKALLATVTDTLSIELLSSHLAHPTQTWVFNEETTKIAIGRCSSNHVAIDSSVVSRYHLILEKLGGTWYLRNLGKNGSYIDGKPVSDAALSGTTVVRLGQTGSYLRLALNALDQCRPETSPKPASKKRIFVGKAARDFIAKRQRVQTMERTETVDPQRATRHATASAVSQRQHCL